MKKKKISIADVAETSKIGLAGIFAGVFCILFAIVYTVFYFTRKRE